MQNNNMTTLTRHHHDVYYVLIPSLLHTKIELFYSIYIFI